MPSPRKGRKVDAGIWKLVDEPGYLVDVSTRDDEGTQLRRRRKFNRLDTAKRWRSDVEAIFSREEFEHLKKTSPSITFRDYAPIYVERWRNDKNPKPSHLLTETQRIENILVPHFGEIPLRKITPEHVSAFLSMRLKDGRKGGHGYRKLDRKGVSAATRNKDLCRIKHMLSFAEDLGYIDRNPARKIKQTKPRIEKQDYLNEADVGEVTKVLETCEDTYYPVIFTAVSTGMRFGRVRTLRWSEVRFKEGCIFLEDTKNRDDLSIPMTRELIDYLKGYKRSAHPANGHRRGSEFCFVNPLTEKPWVDLRRPFRKALEAAGISRHFPLKNLRHTMASNLRDQGVDLDTIGELLGHKTRDMVRRYAVAPPRRLREAMDSLPFKSRNRKRESQKSHTE